MSDDPQDPRPRKKQPANINQRAEVRSRPRQPKPPQSAESRFIGFVVLGFGVLAVIAVLIIAFNNSGSDEANIDKPANDSAIQLVQNPPPPDPTPLNDKAAKDLVTTLSDKLRTPVAPVPRRELNFARQPDLDAAAIQGAWQGILGKYTGVLKLRDNTFQAVLADPNVYSRRYYLAGTYVVSEDLIILQPRDDFPLPLVPAGSDIYYDRVTRARFPVIAALVQGKMLWQNPPRSEKRVPVPYTMPLLMSEDQDYIVWQKL